MRWVLLALLMWLVGCSEKPPPVNRLAGSPRRYLQAHADNPVDWYPWGEEASARARREDKPVLAAKPDVAACVCEGTRCSPPVRSAEELCDMLVR